MLPVERKKYDLPLSERLKLARTEKRLSYAKTIEALGMRGVTCGLSTLIGYEADENSNYHRYPSMIMLLALADLYECSIDYLLGRSENKNGSRIKIKDRAKKYPYSIVK